MITTENIHEFFTIRKEAELLKREQVLQNFDIGFNAFTLVSDIYYRENFHSDVIAAILDINGKHSEGNKYLLEFLSLLNSFQVKVDKSLYQKNILVSREKGRRDITITGMEKHAIIIENKINDANDTSNQIPTYVLQLENINYTVDAVVYLTLNQSKEPDESTWQVGEAKKMEIRRKLISIRAYNGGLDDLCEGWLEKCIQVTLNPDNLSILKQYKKVIKHLTRNHMDIDFFSKFDEYLKQNPQSCEVAIGVKESLEKYPHFILLKVFNYFKQAERFKPFNDIKCYTPNIYYLFNYNIGGFSFSSDVIINDLYGCKFDFSVRTDAVAYKHIYPEIILKIIGAESDFKWNGTGRFEYIINGDFIEFEKGLVNFIERFLQLLKDNEEKIKDGLEKIS